MLICVAITRYAESHSFDIVTDRIGKVSLSIILEDCYGKKNVKLTEYLTAYVNYRKKIFAEDKVNGDVMSEKYIKGDNEFSFDFFGYENNLI